MKNEATIAYIVEGANYAILEESENRETIPEKAFGLFKNRILQEIDKSEKDLAVSAAKAKHKGEFESYRKMKGQLQELRKIKIMIEKDSYDGADSRKRVIMVTEIISILTKVLTSLAWVGAAGAVLSAGTTAVLPVSFVASLGLLTLLLAAVVFISKKLKEYYLGRFREEALQATIQSIMRKVDAKARDETTLYEISKKLRVDNYRFS